jgi:UDP-2,4-diacetamido-2,4,6-trideoxy-beta-L-altropyranose hydrolase
MKVFFRADASLEIGTGHVMRCLTLATALREKGATCLFVCRENPGNLLEVIRERGFEATALSSGETYAKPRSATDGKQLDHAAWLGVDWSIDAEETINIIGETEADWFIVDHYALDARWESAVKSRCRQLMVIDDLADRGHDCELLLDQNLHANLEERYKDFVQSGCKQLLGPRYALLQRDYAHHFDSTETLKGAIHRIFIFFGGADQSNLTGRSISAFLALNRPDINVDVVISAVSPYASAILQQVQGHENIRVHHNLPTLAPLMRQADLAIGAGGVTNWERLCVGLPALVITLADNQHPIAAELHHRRLIHWLGAQGDVEEDDISQALRKLLALETLKNEFSNGTQLVDGMGVSRVLAAMGVDFAAPLRVRTVTLDDEAMLLEWANDSITRASALSGSQITPQVHKQWLLNRLQNTMTCRMFIVETAEGEPIGQARFELLKDGWRVDYSLPPNLRGRGLGRRLLEVALSQLRNEGADAIVFGEVKAQNFASRRVFESLGFSVSSGEGETLKYVSDVKRF